MTDITIKPALSLRGELQLPGDKSISHRALLLAMLSEPDAPIAITNLATGEDVASTLAVIEQLGARVEHDPDDATHVTVTGVGLQGVAQLADGAAIDCGNAGTLARLLSGILAGQSGREFTMLGDASLSSRPMDRITVPLRTMGAQIASSPSGTLPLTITGASPLNAINYEMPMASAQVQGAVLFAGLFADAPSSVTEPAELRDHTERMLRRAGVKIQRTARKVTVHPATELNLPDTQIPADPSSAAPFIAAATLLRGSFLRLPDVLDNHGRSGFLDTLRRMGARIGVLDRGQCDGESTYTLEVENASLGRMFLEVDDVARMIDELPMLGVVGHFCRGETIVRGAAELRVKESDRIEALHLALKGIGIAMQPLRDGFIIKGSAVRLQGGRLDAAGDHRLAMLGGIAGLLSRDGVTIEGAECVDVSFPGFFDVLEDLAVR